VSLESMSLGESLDKEKSETRQGLKMRQEGRGGSVVSVFT